MKLNKRKGTATLAVEVPGPGEVELGGKDLRGQRKTTGGGTVKLTINPRGRAKKKLKKAGKGAVKAEVAYTPEGGDAAEKTKKVKLKRRRS